MTTYLGKSCSFCLPRVPFVNCRQFMYLVISLFGFECRIWDLILSVPDHCLSFYFTAKLLQQGYRYHKLRKTFSKFYRRHYELVSKFNVELKTLLHQGLSEPEFYGDLVYKLK